MYIYVHIYIFIYYISIMNKLNLFCTFKVRNKFAMIEYLKNEVSAHAYIFRSCMHAYL